MTSHTILTFTKERISEKRYRASMAEMIDVDTFLLALDDIEHLGAEIEWLTIGNHGLAKEIVNCHTDTMLMQSKIDHLRAQVDVMMDALQTIDQSACYPADVQPDLPRGDAWALIERIHDIAYKAMKGGG